MIKLSDYLWIIGLTFFSVAVLGYLSIATMFGPWIAPTLVLLMLPLRYVFARSWGNAELQRILLIQSTAAVGGIIAVAIGFSLPMLFFLERSAFDALLSNAPYFCGYLALICGVAGGLGLFLGDLFAKNMIDRDALPFPVSELTCEMALSGRNLREASLLGLGFFGTGLFCFLRDGMLWVKGAIPSLLGMLGIGGIGTTFLSPMFVALGYTMGFSVVPPLLVGLFAKDHVLPWINNHSLYLPFSLFTPMSPSSFAMAFCSGLVLSDVCVGVYRFLKGSLADTTRLKRLLTWPKFISTVRLSVKESSLGVVVLLASCLLLHAVGFSLVEQAVFLAMVMLAGYYINIIGGRIGLIQFGRFSMYILIVMTLLFNISALQMTMVCVFFNICAATASDLLFDYKTALTCGVKREHMRRLQWAGLVLTAVVVGIVFWFLFTYLALGSPLFIAQRSQTKVLLIKSFSFNGYVVLCGCLLGLVLGRLGLSPTMIFSGLFMPPHSVIALSIGGIVTKLWGRHTSALSLCAGAFSAESLWILLSALLKAW